MESRYQTNAELAARKGITGLPLDFLNMVQEVFGNHFEEGLKALAKLVESEPAGFHAQGAVFPNEVVLSVTLGMESQISATTVHASCDFDPKASAPKAEDLLRLCVDAVGSVFQELLNPKDEKRLKQLADESLSALEDVPFDWTPVEVDKQRVFLKIDKSNPRLDDMADQFLRENDPEFLKRQATEEKASEQRFFTGPKKPEDLQDLATDESAEEDRDDDPKGGSGGPGSGLLH